MATKPVTMLHPYFEVNTAIRNKLVEWGTEKLFASPDEEINILCTSGELYGLFSDWAEAREPLHGRDYIAPVNFDVTYPGTTRLGDFQQNAGKYNLVVLDHTIFLHNTQLFQTIKSTLEAAFILLKPGEGNQVILLLPQLTQERGIPGYREFIKWVALNGEFTDWPRKNEFLNRSFSVVTLTKEDQSWKKKLFNSGGGTPRYNWNVFTLLYTAETSFESYELAKEVLFQALRTRNIILKVGEINLKLFKELRKLFDPILLWCWEHNTGIDLTSDDYETLYMDFLEDYEEWLKENPQEPLYFKIK
jgi:hypothetical protein